MFELLFIAFGLVVLIIFAPVAYIGNAIHIVLKGRSMGEYHETIALGLDHLGGSLIYGEEKWSVSGYTYKLRKDHRDRLEVKIFEAVINGIFFDRKHCKKAYHSDLQKMVNELKEEEHY